MIRFKIRHNLREVEKAIREAKDFRSPYRAAARVVRAEIRRALETQGASLGRPFAPNTATYRAEKVRRGLSDKVMTATGRTLRGLSSSIRTTIKADRVSFHFSGKAAFAQKTSPRRVWFTFSPRAAAYILRRLDTHIQQQFDRVRRSGRLR
ncbi:MAG: phage virion morphogenesis protein [Myxococcota bacterium]